MSTSTARQECATLITFVHHVQNYRQTPHRCLKGGFYGNKILYKNLDLTQDFPNKISFHFLWVKMLPKNLPKIFRWPEMCPLGKILAQDFQMAAFTKKLGRRDRSVAASLPRKIFKHSLKRTQLMYGGDCDAAIAKAAAAVTHGQSQSEEVGSGDEGLGLLCFDLSSAETDFWWLEDEQ